MQFGCPHCGKEMRLMIERLKKERDHRPPPSARAEELVEFFRETYLKVVDPSYLGFKKPYPASELKAAEFLTKFHKDAVRQVIVWVSRDQCDQGRWTGWAHQIRSLAKLKEKWAVLEQKARQAGTVALAPGKGTRPPDHELERLLQEERARLQATTPAPSYEGMTDQQFILADRKREIQIMGQARKNLAERLGIEL